jgi:hypothetical protein
MTDGFAPIANPAKKNGKEKEVRAKRKIIKSTTYFVLSDSGEELIFLLEKEGADYSIFILLHENEFLENENFSIGPFFKSKSSKISLSHFTFHKNIRNYLSNNLNINLLRFFDIDEFVRLVEIVIKLRKNLIML